MTTEPQEDAIAAPLPRIFGRYLLIHRLSRGGMGEIFLARFGLAGFEKLTVIKKVLPHLAADEEFIGRFVTEAQVAVKLQHANIAQVFEVGRVGDEYFLALEYLHGRDLRRTLSLLTDSGRGVPPDLALFIAREVANALAYAHRRVDEDGRQLGLVHCDISPPNVMMSFEGEVKIIDFGIAKSALMAMDENSKRGFGKFGYMAPEQLIRGRQVEAGTDIYALGAVLFEMLTGSRLYELGETPDYRSLARMAAKGQHPLPSDHDPTLAPFDELVSRALKPKVEDRYLTAAEFRDAIQRQLVELNPTISTDELAAFMRFMFAEDVIRQQEEIERLDKTQLSQWESELTKEAQETVSFALGHDMTRTASVDVPVPVDLAAGARKLVEVAEELEELEADNRRDVSSHAGSDRTELVGLTEDAAPPRRFVAGWIAAAVLVLGLGAAAAWTLRDSGPEATATHAERGLAAAATPVDAGPAEIRADGASVAAADEDERTATAPGGDGGREPRVKPENSENRAIIEAPDDKEDTAVVSDARQKFRRANAEYKQFRKKHGLELHAEWTEILKFATFAKADTGKSAALVKKIDAFRAKMRKIESETL